MHQTVVIDVVGLSGELLGQDTPNLTALASTGQQRVIQGMLPAVTCSVQSTYLTGRTPAQHGIVGNGWYFRDLAQVWFWRQSNRLVEGEKIWETARARAPGLTCAKLFWWYNLYSSADWSVTPRPIYPADGRKIPEIYSAPGELGARLKAELGEFPFFDFWGPKSGIRSSEWIAAAGRLVLDWYAPSLTLIYLPHLDYNLQRLGPNDPALREDVRAIDRVCGELTRHATARGARVIVLSEYGIVPVRKPVHINRALREDGWLSVRNELGLEMLDPGASRAFAVADHQVAHVYVRDAGEISAVRRLLESLPGVERVLDERGKAEEHLDHPRAGELVAIAEPQRWFTYYYWLDDAVAPDFARTVDIHRKPGYDPVELFVEPKSPLLPLKVAWILLRKNLGFRYLMNIIPLDANLVRGSHGRVPESPRQGPVLVSGERLPLPEGPLPAQQVRDVILQHLFEQ